MLFNQSRGFKHYDSETDIAFLCGQNSCDCLDNIPGWGIRRKIYESREPGDYVHVKEVYGSQSISLNQDSYHIKISQQSPGVTKSLSSCAWSIYNSTSFIQHHQFKLCMLLTIDGLLNRWHFFLSWLYALNVNSSPLVLHICLSELGQLWFRWWLVTYSVPGHYLNPCWVIINWAIINKLQ